MKETNKFRNVILWTMGIAIGLGMAACSQTQDLPTVEDQPSEVAGDSVHCYQVIWKGVRPSYEGTTRSSEAWPDKSRVYFRLTAGSKIMAAVAIYSQDTDNWILNYGGNLPETQNSAATAFFFEDALKHDVSTVELSANSAVYSDAAASYSFDGTTVSLFAALKPTKMRIRFSGDASRTLEVSGLEYATFFKTEDGTFVTSKDPISVKIASTATDGKYFTPYLYGALTADRVLTVSDAQYNYTKTIPTTFVAGMSGAITAPTFDVHVGWNIVKKGLSPTWSSSVTTTQKTLLTELIANMVKIEGGTFMMGAQSSNSDGTNYDTEAYNNEGSVHQVTLSPYYLCKYELSQKIWLAVMGSNPSNFSNDTSRPVERVSWNDCQTFIAKINSLTGLTFRLPTEAEWEYAARGGSKSKGYKYSGSTNIESVAWYTSNASSTTHPVGTKSPNELELYDMSGNVWEWCSDWYSSSYSSTSQTNPTGPTSGSYRVLRGGSWYNNATNCRVSYRNDTSPDTQGSNYGFRLAAALP